MFFKNLSMVILLKLTKNFLFFIWSNFDDELSDWLRYDMQEVNNYLFFTCITEHLLFYLFYFLAYQNLDNTKYKQIQSTYIYTWFTCQTNEFTFELIFIYFYQIFQLILFEKATVFSLFYLIICYNYCSLFDN